jgi:hypothetical protein
MYRYEVNTVVAKFFPSSSLLKIGHPLEVLPFATLPKHKLITAKQSSFPHSLKNIHSNISTMKVTLALVALAASVLATNIGRNTDNDECSADNCARAVTGTRFPLPVQSSHKADCSSFMAVTKESDGE